MFNDMQAIGIMEIVYNCLISVGLIKKRFNINISNNLIIGLFWSFWFRLTETSHGKECLSDVCLKTFYSLMTNVQPTLDTQTRFQPIKILSLIKGDSALWNTHSQHPNWAVNEHFRETCVHGCDTLKSDLSKGELSCREWSSAGGWMITVTCSAVLSQRGLMHVRFSHQLIGSAFHNWPT